MAGEQVARPDAASTEDDLQGLSEADRALVLEARRRLQARRLKPYVNEMLERRIKSELGIEPEEKTD